MLIFKPAWWLPNGHLQTLWARFTRVSEDIIGQEERLELPDGDFLDLNWVGSNTGPIIIVLHGLAGDIHSPYAQGMLHAIDQQQWRGLFVHFRGASGTPNRLPRFYHSGETDDLSYVINELRRREPNTPVAIVAYSLGANILLRWLAKYQDSFIKAAVAVSVPFELQKTAEHMNRGFAQLYQWYLLDKLREIIQMKRALGLVDLTSEEINNLKNFWQFDNRVTAPLHGFKNAEDYYTQCSSRPILKAITTPTLILQAKDDPFMPKDIIPDASELSAQINFELHESGGHVGFVAGNYPWEPIYWLEHRIINYLRDYL